MILPVPCSILIYLTLWGGHIVYKYVSRDRPFLEYCQFLLDDRVVVAKSWGNSKILEASSRVLSHYTVTPCAVYTVAPYALQQVHYRSS